MSITDKESKFVNLVVNKLLNGNSLTDNEMCFTFDLLLQDKLDVANLAAILALQSAKGITVNELISARESAYTYLKPKIDCLISDLDFGNALDIVGTGGDKQNLFNISTAATIVASAMGYQVAKHGNSGVSSLSGASDVLTELGLNYKVSSLQPSIELFKRTGFTFLFAPIFHSGFKIATPVRKSLGIPTIFNILGPLVNPVRPGRNMFGVADIKTFKLYSELALEVNKKSLESGKQIKSIVVHGQPINGVLDEVSLNGSTKVAIIEEGSLQYLTINASDFGLQEFDLEHLKGRDANYNAEQIRLALQGKNIYLAQAIAANLALALHMYDKKDLISNTKEILEFIDTGKVLDNLEHIICVNNKLILQYNN